MNKSHKKFCVTLSYIEHFLILISAVTGCVSISAFASWVSIAKGIMIFAIGLNICTIIAGIKKYKKKKKAKRSMIK